MLFTDQALGVTLALNEGVTVTAVINGSDDDTVVNVENIVGGDGDDIFTGDGLANRLEGGAGSDKLSGGLGDDFLMGGAGADTIDGGGGIDTVLFTDQTLGVVLALKADKVATALVGGAIDDTVINVENIVGGAGADALTGDDLDNVLEGGAGDDVLSGGAGLDTLDGGSGIDTASYAEKTLSVAVTLNRSSTVVVTIDGTAEDSIRNIENVIGGAGDDTLVGDLSVNVLSGGGGDDILQGMGGADTIDGGSGTDTVVFVEKIAPVELALELGADAVALMNGVAEDIVRNVENIIGGSGADVLSGDTGSNRIEGRGGNDIIAGRGGKDTLDGGAGIDTASYAEKNEAVVVTLNGAAPVWVNVGGADEDFDRQFRESDRRLRRRPTDRRRPGQHAGRRRRRRHAFRWRRRRSAGGARGQGHH